MQKSITVNCQKENLKKIRSFLSDSLRSTPIDEQETNLVILAVDEVCANIIIHANGCDPKQELSLHFEYEEQDKALEIEIVDQGILFDYSSYQEPDLQELIQDQKKGSLGLMLVRRIMDKIVFKKKEERNYCILSKSF